VDDWQKAVQGFGGYKEYVSEQAFDLAFMAVEIWLEQGDKSWAFRVKEMADEMETKKRKSLGFFEKYIKGREIFWLKHPLIYVREGICARGFRLNPLGRNDGI